MDSSLQGSGENVVIQSKISRQTCLGNVYFFLGGGSGGDWPIRDLKTDHGISGPMRGLKINITVRGNR